MMRLNSLVNSTSLFNYIIILISLFNIIQSQVITDDNDNNSTKIQPPYDFHLIEVPKVILYDFKLDLKVSIIYNQIQFNQSIPYSIYQGNSKDIKQAQLIKEGTFNMKLNVLNEFNDEEKIEEGVLLSKFIINDIELKNDVNRHFFIVIYNQHKDKIINQYHTIIHGMPGWVTLIPIIVLLAIALFSNQALVALVCGVFLAATFINGFDPLQGFLRMLDYYTIHSLADLDHAKIAMFTFYLSGMIAMVQKSGGAQALSELVTKFATNRLRGQWATFIVGVIIFLDDTASIMIVGANFLNVSDRLNLSREKLAFLVHATSSPVSSLSPVSSWIGFQVGLIALQLNALKINDDPFVIFLQTIPSRYYPLFMLFLTMLTIGLKREFGPMLLAERRAYLEGKTVVEEHDSNNDSNNQLNEMNSNEIDPLQPNPNTPKRWYNAAIPILMTIIITVISLMVSGYYSLLDQQESGKKVQFTAAEIAGAGDPYGSLLYASFMGCLTCLFIYRVQKLFSLSECIEVLIHGVKDVVETLIILILAWAIGNAFLDLNCAKFLVSALSTSLPKGVVPSIAFLFACVISFTTGTSWGTTTIMFPLVIPLAHETAPGDRALLLNTVSAILAGALFGDQCSPISSTTILTCLTSKVAVRAHVNSQLPYGLLVVVLSLLLGYLPLGYQIYPDWAGLLIGFGCLILIFIIIGDRSDLYLDDMERSTYGWIGNWFLKWNVFSKLFNKRDNNDTLDLSKDFETNQLPSNLNNITEIEEGTSSSSNIRNPKDCSVATTKTKEF